jgi:hypothetical protein
MNDPNISLVMTDTNITVFKSLLESLLVQKAKLCGIKPVLFCLTDNLLYHSHTGRPATGEEFFRNYPSITSEDIPCYRKQDTMEILNGILKEKNKEYFADRDVLIFTDQPFMEKMTSTPEHVILFVESLPSSIPFVYKINQALKAKKMHPLFTLVFVNTKAIEKAAESFLHIQTEIAALDPNGPTFRFGGNLFIEPYELELYLSRNKPLIQLFPEGSLHGQIKYCVRKALPESSQDNFIPFTDCMSAVKNAMVIGA